MKRATLITDAKQRLYYTGFSSTAGYVILFEGRKIFAVDNRYFHAAEQRLKPKGIEVVSCGDYSELIKFVVENGIGELGVDFKLTTLSQSEELSALNVKLIDVSSDIEREMSIKRADELDNIRIACGIAEKAFSELLGSIKEGVTEAQLAAELEFNFKKYGASDKSFDTIVAFGENAAVPHHETGADKLKRNQCVLIDFGCLYNGYCSDMTRTLFFGTPDAEFSAAYNDVLDAHLAALNGIKAGMAGIEADAIARNVLQKAGRGDYFTHSLGHGIGVNIHEFPWISPRGAAKLENGMVFSDEPGVYYNGKFGIRIEDTCYMEGGKVKSMMTLTKQLICL